ncbi:MAG TPA: SIMPL domain-containing protein [Candidatus Baltobacteraceae bacterium]|nr:SIMPL domain-containing protein [Candidatus Baltobacteraceae bacterium]
MDTTAIRTRPSGRRRAALVIPAFALLLAGCAAAGSAGGTPSTAPTGVLPGAAALGAPAVGQLDGTAGSGTSSASAPNVAVAYPYPVFGGSAGLAPDHELVVSGTGTATLKADGSDRATAQRTALAAAIADAKSQAQAAATDAGVTLGSVVSMSVSVGGGYVGVVPMDASGTPETAPSSSGTVIPPAAGTAPSIPTTEQLVVTVTVAYTIS